MSGMSSGAARLWEAAERGDAQAVQEELDKGAPVDVVGALPHKALPLSDTTAPPPMGPIHITTTRDSHTNHCRSHTPTARCAAVLPGLSAGKTSWTALHRAADRGWVNAVRVLLQNGARFVFYSPSSQLSPPFRLVYSTGSEKHGGVLSQFVFVRSAFLAWFALMLRHAADVVVAPRRRCVLLRSHACLRCATWTHDTARWRKPKPGTTRHCTSLRRAGTST